MRTIAAAELRSSLDYAALVDRIEEAFREGAAVPVRHHHRLPVPGEADATLLLMPAWREGRYLGVKIATVYPGNGARGLPAVMASYVLMDGRTGEPLALIDGPELTARRTAAASALASRHLSRTDSRRLLVVGTGVMAPHLAGAHAAVRPIREVAVWGRNPDKAGRLAARLAREPAFSGHAVAAAPELEPAVAAADIVSCATLSREPLVLGRWLKPGQHIDLIGAYTPEMREADDEALQRARVFVDTRAGALHEGGDVVQAIRSGAITEAHVEADLFDLARGAKAGRRSAGEITLFKSTGTALEDLAAAVLAYERMA
jgi:ornithine cyclodeaminase